MAQFNAPIPGQSLGDTPGNAAWERPPQYTNPEDALHMHLENLNDPEVIDSLIGIVDSSGMDVKTLTEGILRNAQAAGKHSVDVSMLIAPVVHEYIKGTLDAAGVPYEEGMVDKEAKEQKQKARARLMSQRVREEVSGSQPVEEEAPVEEPQATPPPGQGLVSRPSRGGM